MMEQSLIACRSKCQRNAIRIASRQTTGVEARVSEFLVAGSAPMASYMEIIGFQYMSPLDIKDFLLSKTLIYYN